MESVSISESKNDCSSIFASSTEEDVEMLAENGKKPEYW